MASQNQTRLMNQVKAVYEAIATDNLTAACKKGTLLLKENPKNDWARMVWVDLLLHQNKLQEASAFVDKNFNGTSAVDLQVLSKASRILKRLRKDDYLVALCKQTWAAHQNTKNAQACGHEIFSAYVRHGNLNLLKQFSAELGKKFNDNKYMVWNVVATALGAVHANNPMFVQLAAMMFKRHFQEKPSTEQELFFFCWFLNKVGKPVDALELLDGDLGKKVIKIEHQRLEKIAEMLMASNDWAKALAVYEDLAKNYMDDWKWYEGCLNCTFEICASSPENKEELIGNITKLIDEKKVVNEGALNERNPYLARIELEKRLLTHGSEDTSKLHALCVEYFETFGSKPCAYHDLLPHLPNITSEKRIEFLDTLSSIVAKHESNKRKWVEFSSSFYQIERALKKPTTTEEALTKAMDLFKIYLDSEILPGEGKDRRPTERGIGDTLGLLAAHYLIDSWESSNHDTSYLIVVTTLLEYCLRQSPTNFQFQVLLMRLLGNLGSIQRLFEIWETMDIRNVLCDSLPHLVLPDVLRYLGATEAGKIFKLVEKIHSDHESKMAGHIANCYFRGAYSQIDEFTSFKARLDRSSQLYIVDCESTHLHLLQKGNTKEGAVKILDSSPLNDLQELLIATEIIPAPKPPVPAAAPTPATNISPEEFLKYNQDWVVIDQWDLTPRKERKSWLWKGLLDEEASNSAHCQKSTYPGAPENKHHVVLQLRSLQLLMFRDLVTSDDVKQDYVVGYEKLLNKSGFEVFESSEVEEGKESLVFDSANSFAFFFASRVTLGLKEFSSQMKAEKTDLPALIKAGDELLKDLVSLFSTLTHIKTITTKAASESKKIPRVSAASHTLNFLVFFVLQQVASIPKQARKTLVDAAKDKHGEVKQKLKDVVAHLKEILVSISSQVDELAKSSAPFSPVAQQVLDLIPEGRTILEQVQTTQNSARKVTLMRLQDILRDRSKLIQPCKL